MFTNYMGYLMQVHLDDMLVKTLNADKHLYHIRQAFKVLQKYNMKLNPGGYSFGVASSKFLGFMVTQCGIEYNPDQIHSVMKVSSPTLIRNV